jgi:hypothetical protein
MDNLPRQKLSELIVQYGRSLCDDPKRCEAFLRDYCGQYRKEISVLVGVIKERVPADLLASHNSTPPDVLLARLTKRLEDNLGLAQESAKWAVESWAWALGVINETDIAEGKREILKEYVNQTPSPSLPLPKSIKELPPVPPLLNTEPLDIKPSSKSNSLSIFITILLSTFIATGALYTMSISRQNNTTSINPPVTNPPVTNPPVTNPPVTNPPVTNPPVTNPPVTNPPVTNPTSANTFGNAAIGGNPGSKNIRTGPGTEFPTVTQISVGERVEIKGIVINKDIYPWFRIRTSSGVEGLIACHLIDCDPTVRFCEKCPPPP